MVLKILTLAAFSLAGLLTVSLGCSQPTEIYIEPTLDWKMMKSKIVVYGVPLSKTTDARPFIGEAYSVQFQIRCIFKGAPLEDVITIDNVGVIHGHCFATQLDVGSKYLVYLREMHQGHFTLDYAQDPGNSEYLEEVVAMCGITITYPNGRNKTHNNEVCPETENNIHDDCLPQPVTRDITIHIDDDQDTSVSPDSSVDREHTKPPDTVTKATYEPVAVQVQLNDDNNGCKVLAWHISLLTCLLLPVFLQ